MASVKNTEKTENSQTPNKSGVYAGSFIRCRNVSQSFDLSETITEKIEDITEKLEGFKKDVSQSFQEFTKEWSGRQNQAPPWQKQKHILRGYRIGLSMKETILSLFALHNETMNVWTHLVGSLYFLCTLLYNGPVLSKISSSATVQSAMLPTWPLSIYAISATLCMGLSAIFHLLLNYDYQMNKFVSSLDYAGISILIAGSFFPVLEYGFCNSGTRCLYLGGLSILTLFTVSFALYDWEHKIFHGKTQKWIRFRNFSFAAQGIYGVVSINFHYMVACNLLYHRVVLTTTKYN
jgi:predicted membrane channel-forming protein YqfA (hemolysin III family)